MAFRWPTSAGRPESANWKKKYEGMQPPEMRRLKQLEDENAKLKKIVADLSLDREMLQDVIRRKP
jgi:putative transposase